MTDTPEGRVTLAVIQSDIRHLTALLEEHIRDDSARSVDHESRLRCIEHQEIPGVKMRLAQIEERQGLFATGQTVFTVIAATLAGWFGSRQ